MFNQSPVSFDPRYLERWIRTGWVPAIGTWTYNSVSGILGIINTPAGNGSIFMPGTRVRLVQNSTTKMFFVVSRTDTTVTVTGGSTYTLTNDAISDVYYSGDPVPPLFPGWFDYVVSFGGFSTPPSSVFHRFQMLGRAIKLTAWSAVSGVSNATTLTFNAPILSANNGLDWVGVGQGVNNGSVLTAPVLLKLAANSTTVECYTSWAGGAWTAGNTAKRIVAGCLEYEV